MGGSVLGIIPARGGSKGIPGKNIRTLAGRPLLAYTVDSARESGVIDRCILSTDSPEIAEVGRQLGVEVPFLRPAELALDETPTVPVLVHAVSYLEERGWRPDIIALLQPTSPLRRRQHIVDAVETLRSTKCDSVVSVNEVPRHLSPDYVMKIEDGKLTNFLPGGERYTRRQDARTAYVREGTIYVFWRDLLMDAGTIYGDNCRALILPSEESLTIDTMDDWETAERLIDKGRVG